MRFSFSDTNSKIKLPFNSGNLVFQQAQVISGDIPDMEFKVTGFRLNGGRSEQVFDLQAWQSPMDKNNIVGFDYFDGKLQYFLPPNYDHYYIETSGKDKYSFTLEFDRIPN